jgi:hypothetical protein
MSDADRGIARQIALTGKRSDALHVTASTTVPRVEIRRMTSSK